MKKTRLNGGLSLALLAMLAASCGGGNGKTDAKADARDSGTETGSDRVDMTTSTEGGPDVRPDVQPDVTVGPDVQPDVTVGPDVQPDVTVGPDVQPDVTVGPDVQPDVAGPDVQPDTGGPDVVTPTYIISGNVSGLAGTGLVLRNGTENITVAPTATIVPFAFTSRVPTGGTYAVTVMTQPSAPTQICTVTLGSGTVASANVTNIAVACSTQSFSVSYTVTGLAGTGMVVRNNGLAASDMPVTANGTFSFPAQLSGSAYAVTVQTQPSSPTQICTVANGSGTVGGANVTNVAITCATQAFTIGGTISGLSGTVVLRNSAMASTDLSRTTNGAFTFVAPVATGGTYAVTVQTQPAGQICTVANGSGTVAAANVTNVAVTCVNTYTIGGTIAGLAASTSVVLDFGGAGAPADVTRTTNGVYASAGVVTGTAYTVTVQTPPAGQTCTVANPTGTVGTADVTNVNVTCTTTPVTFTIGGTVSGLGAGLMVTLDFGAAAGAPADVTRNADGVYASAAVPTGTAYTVTVQTPPVGQTCTVANPTGTVAAANVTNVNVTCTTTPTTFSIGGTVAGLGAGLMVTLDFGAAANAPADVTRNANGVYASALVPTGTAYTVTVQTPPVGQTCTVANPTGTVAAANVTNVNVTCTNGTAAHVCAIGPFDPMPTGTGDDAVLTCPGPVGQVITAIEFASFGTPSGTCLTYIQDHPPTEPAGSPVCHSATSLSRVTAACMGMHSCTVTASQAPDPAGFGDPCQGFSKWLVFRATCQ